MEKTETKQKKQRGDTGTTKQKKTQHPKATKENYTQEIKPTLCSYGGAGLTGGQLMGRRWQSRRGLDVHFFVGAETPQEDSGARSRLRTQFPTQKGLTGSNRTEVEDSQLRHQKTRLSSCLVPVSLRSVPAQGQQSRAALPSAVPHSCLRQAGDAPQPFLGLLTRYNSRLGRRQGLLGKSRWDLFVAGQK